MENMKNLAQWNLIPINENELKMINGGSDAGDWLISAIGGVYCWFAGLSFEESNYQPNSGQEAFVFNSGGLKY